MPETTQIDVNQFTSHHVSSLQRSKKSWPYVAVSPIRLYSKSNFNDDEQIADRRSLRCFMVLEAALKYFQSAGCQ